MKIENKNQKVSTDTIKCNNCGYIGSGKLARNSTMVALAWILLFTSGPILTLLYFLGTNKYKCQNCDTENIFVKNKNDNFTQQIFGWKKQGKAFLVVFGVIALIGIFSSILLTLINDK